MASRLDSERRLAAAEPLETSRDVLYRSLFEHALLEVHIWALVRDDAGEIRAWRLVDANPAALRSWGRELSDVVGLTADEMFPDANPTETFMPIVEEIIRTGRPKEWEVSFPQTGQVLHMVSYPVGTGHFVSTGYDVSLLRRRERELDDALVGLNQAIRAGGVGLWDWELKTDRVRYSDEWKRQLGCAPDEISDSFEEWRRRVHPDDLGPAMEAVTALVEARTDIYDVAFRMKHADGSYRWILSQASPVGSEDGRPTRIQGSHLDITERRRLEERVLEAQKLQSVSTLAAGIAHDFNNLLTAMTGNLSLLQSMPLGDPEAVELIEEVSTAASRAQALTGQLLTFAKGGAPVRELASIRDLVEDTARFVVRGTATQCRFDLEKDLASVDADVGQISQVINNLVINATQAMPSGGTVRVAARNRALVPGNAEDLAPGPYVEVSVADDGAGIRPEDLPRIFDPFFTTKAGGSGLGLSTSYSIVARHGGRIHAESEPGRGTVFRVLLPASSAKAPERSRPTPTAGAGRILVMDDDSALRRVMQRMLRRLGYESDVSRDGDEALAQYEQALRAGRRHDAVILDLTISGKAGGEEVLARLREVDPGVRAIVASGYAEDDVLAHHERHGFVGRLRKPLDVARLGAELSRVLAGSLGP